MGLRVIINDMDFSNNNIGNIFDVPIEGITISKVDGTSNTFTIVPTFIPANTTETSVTYSVVSGDATISGNVVLYSSTGDVTVRCQSNDNPSVYAEETYSVTFVEDNIVFQDSVVKQVLVANYDTNNDGEISLYEAANAAPFKIDDTASSIFRNVLSQIEYFEELKYFTQITSFTCTGTTLKTIELPNSVTSLYMSYNGQLESIVFNSKVNSLYAQCFKDCSKLTSIEAWAKSAVGGCFQGCTLLTNIKFKEGLESLGQQVFNNLSTQVVDLPSTLTSVSGQLFRSSGLPKFIVRATTPPTWTDASSYGAPSNLAIYVPDASVDAYKAATGWSSVASKIHPLSDIENS